MEEFCHRLPVLLTERQEFLPMLRVNAQNIGRDKNGSASASVANSLRFIAVARYILHHDILSFQANLAESARTRLRLFERFDAGEPISKSYVAMLAYKSLFSALAAGDFQLASDLAARMGSRSAIEKEYDHPFDYALGYTLRAFVLADGPEMHKWAKNFSEVCKENANWNFQGYADMFNTMLSADADKANAALMVLVKGHEKESKGNGVFRDSEDEALCVWGIGMANLARSRGTAVAPVPPLVPSDLLV
jgi:hypothetical protein